MFVNTQNACNLCFRRQRCAERWTRIGASKPVAGGFHGGAPDESIQSVRVNKVRAVIYKKNLRFLKYSFKSKSLPFQCFREHYSRREADDFVERGRVTVNGRVATPGQKVSVGDRVALDGRVVDWETLQAELQPAAAKSAKGTVRVLALEERFVYIKYNKPIGVVTTTDQREPANIIDAVRFPGARLFPVGRLDRDSSGLILLSSDGRLPNAMLGARSGAVGKVYEVRVDAPLTNAALTALREGVVITTVAQRDRTAKALTAKTLPAAVQRVGSSGTEFCITLKEGRNRQIRRMCEALGYSVVKLHRVNFAGIALGGLAPGMWRHLDDKEMGVVRECVQRRDQAPPPSSHAAQQQQREAQGGRSATMMRWHRRGGDGDDGYERREE